MNLLTVILLTALADAPVFEVSTISGEQVTGQLESVSGETWTLIADGQSRQFEARDVLEARLTNPGVSATTPPPHTVVLRDGSRLRAGSLTLTGQQTAIQSDAAGALSVARAALSSVRLAESPSSLDDKWDEYVDRERQQDMLIIRKGDALDFVEGVVGDITSDTVNLLLDGDNVPVPRARVFGILFYQRGATAMKPRGFLELTTGDRLAIKSMALADGRIDATLTVGSLLQLPLASISGMDFSLDKLTWLSTLEPRDVKHQSLFIEPARAFENDRDVWGKRLRIGRTTYARGVCIRSKTSISYRLNGDYSRLQAWAGIQHGYSGDVRITISADGQTLYEEAVSPVETEPRRIDLDVQGRFTVVILVDYGTVENDIGDHLVLGDARLLK